MKKVNKLYGALDNLPTMRALLVLLEHDVEFEFIPIDVEAGENKTEFFLSLNPFGQIPVYQYGRSDNV
ncbi:Glutathione S-transferase, N-terminal, partial [Dillenia turbinata]